MKEFIDLLNYLGLNVTESTNPLILFLGWVLLFNIFALLCVLNIAIYIASIYLLENKHVLSKVKSYLPSFINSYFDRIVNYYKAIRLIVIVFEVVLLLLILLTIIYLTSNLIYIML